MDKEKVNLVRRAVSLAISSGPFLTVNSWARNPRGYPVGPVAPVQAATPTFSPSGGSYSSSQTVTISCATPSSTIYYTTNGTTPTTSSPVYSSSISVSATSLVQAIATASGYSQSNVGSANYTIAVGPTGFMKFFAGRLMASESDEQTTPYSQWQNECNIWAANPTGFLGVRYTLDWKDTEDFTQTRNLNNPAALTVQYYGLLDNLQPAFYYAMGVSGGTGLFGFYHNFESTTTVSNSDITGYNWSTFTEFHAVPYWISRCTGISGTATPGTLTVPDYYGASTTALYSGPIAPIYTGASYYGFGFSAYNPGTNEFETILPAWWNPAVNQARVQCVQATAQFQFTAGAAWNSGTAYTIGIPVTYAGQNWLSVANNTNSAPSGSNANWIVNVWVGTTIDTNSNIWRAGTNDEDSYNLTSSSNISGGQTVNPPTSGGFSAIAPTSANFQAQRSRYFAAARAATPHTPYDCCESSGFDTSSPFDGPSNLPGYWNNYISGSGMSAIQGLAFSNSNFMATTYASGDNAIASAYQQGHVGISPAAGPSTPFTLPTPSYTSLVQIKEVCVQHQLEDYWKNLGSGVASSSPAAVTALRAPGEYLSTTCEVWCCATSDASYSAPYSPTFYTNVIQPTLASVPIPSAALPQDLMVAPPNFYVTTTATTATLNWLAQTIYTGTGLVYQIFRNGTLIETTANTSLSTYTDMGLSPNTTYIYTINVYNGLAGPQATYAATTAVFSYSTFAGASSTITTANDAADITGALLRINNGAVGAHQAGGGWYNSKVNVQSFMMQTTFQLPSTAQLAAATGGGAPPQVCGMTFCLQNSANYPVLDSVATDANMLGYGSYSNQTPLDNSVGLKFDLSANNSNANVIYQPGGAPSTTGLYTGGGPFAVLSANNDLNPYGIDLYNGNVMSLKLTYDGTLLTMVIEDTITNAQARYVWPIDIPNWVGANIAYAGFTAGAIPAIVTSIKTWTYWQGYTTRLATPTFSVAPGEYSSTQSVALSGPVGASLYYTLNGLLPTSGSTLYTGAPISISSNQIIQVVAIQPGYTDSLVAQGVYQIGTSNIVNCPSEFSANNGIVLNGNAYINGTAIQMTDTTSGNSSPGFGLFEVSTAWWGALANIAVFSTDFTIQATSSNTGSSYGLGLTFCIQNQPATGSIPSAQGVVTGGPQALGNSGAALGYSYIPAGTLTGTTGGLLQSIAIKFDLYNNSTGLYLEGVQPTATGEVAITGITLNSNHAITVALTYDGTTLSMLMTDTVTSTTFSHSWAVDIPSTVGASAGYVGFTAASGYFIASQKISSWTFQ